MRRQNTDFTERWTVRAIHAECVRTHGRYKRALQSRYRGFFDQNPELASAHPWKARDLASALPPGRSSLGDVLPRASRHHAFLSGGSSQVIAVALLGSACDGGSALTWLAELAELPTGALRESTAEFEYALDAELLGESPYVTNVDLLAHGPGAVVCVEAKYWESGLGGCRCGQGSSGRDADELQKDQIPAQERGACSARVRSRGLYYAAASDVLGLPARRDGVPCPIAPTYQAVRNIAAARALAAGRPAAFVLMYDARNPYFSGAGEWPGWAAALEGLAAEQDHVIVRACSWQRLLGSGAVPDDVVQWALVKHGLDAD